MCKPLRLAHITTLIIRFLLVLKQNARLIKELGQKHHIKQDAPLIPGYSPLSKFRKKLYHAVI